MFFKKKKVKEEKTEKFYIPKEAIDSICKKIDSIQYSDKEKYSDKYKLWKHLDNLFPELDLSESIWALDMDTILTPYIYKK